MGKVSELKDVIESSLRTIKNLPHKVTYELDGVLVHVENQGDGWMLITDDEELSDKLNYNADHTIRYTSKAEAIKTLKSFASRGR